MATCNDLGFRVVSRAGASIKRTAGHNDVHEIVEAYRGFTQHRYDAGAIVRLRESPPAAAVPGNELLNDRWTAGFYKTERLAALQRIEQLKAKGFEARPLPELASIDSGRSERIRADDDNRCISVLHISENGCVDLRAVAAYRPATACVRCRPGDVLLSKINPRIPRLCVVPETEWNLACSTEFAVLRCRPGGVPPWEFSLLLRSDAVQSQIRALTSGTSSSHNRIKNRDLCSIIVPTPSRGSTAARTLKDLARRCEQATRQEYAAQSGIAACFSALERLTG
jgi:hypothetical protein